MTNSTLCLQNSQKGLSKGATDMLSHFEGPKHIGEGREDITYDIPRVGSYSQMKRLVRNLTTIAVEEKEQHVKSEVLLDFVFFYRRRGSYTTHISLAKGPVHL